MWTSSLQDLQQELTQCEVHPWLAEQLHRLLALPFDCILTPNFTYEVECALFPDFLNHPQRFLRHTAAVPRAEKYFMLHTYYSLPLARGNIPLFHVHGEARVPNTVILGHYYYGNLLFLLRRVPHPPGPGAALPPVARPRGAGGPQLAGLFHPRGRVLPGVWV